MSHQLDLARESAITLAQVPNHVPKRNGKKAHYSTVYRWVTKGARGRRLESLLVGGVRYTTIEAVKRFLRAPPNSYEDLGAIPASQADLDAVTRALNEAGV